MKMKKIILITVLIFGAIITEAQNSLYTRDTLAVNQVFRQRVKSATVYASQQIAADTSEHNLYKLQFANVVINNPDGGWISSMAYQVIAEGLITYESTDNDIQFTVNANFKKVSEAYYGVVPEDAGVDPDIGN